MNELAEEVDIDFYQDKDESAFLEAWEEKYGPITNDEIDELYQKIALDIREKVQTEQIKLGKKYMYQEVLVGYCDYSAGNNLFLFGQSKK
ncbi:hypothetical protein [Carnobacterium funditum]|uniref:hypothetical protein n=1 Tax=Carnobacterium funditum TaxID=2752 RepID=UPI001B801908|nr:hypothetical protein [Carnobacterium funditum]